MYDFQKQLEQSVIGWNEVAQRMVGGEGKVKDVCADCNNRVLGELDAYGKQLITNSGLLVQNYTKRDLRLQYDYSLLLRWLLKVSFNSSRTDGAHSPLFERYVPFMRGLEPSPSRSQVALLLYLARPEMLGASRIAEVPFVRIANGSSILNPFLVRICYGVIPGEHRYVLRLNIFGPAVFYLMMFEDSVLPGHAASAIRQLVRLTPGAVELGPKRKVVEVQAGQKSWLDLYEHQVARARSLETSTLEPSFSMLTDFPEFTMARLVGGRPSIP
jgi:hypothetical protein